MSAAEVPSSSESIRGELQSDAALNIVGKAAGILAGFVAGAVLVLVNEVLAARLLGLQTYGLFALAFAVAKVTEKLSLLGLNLAAQHFVPVFHSANDRARLKGVIISSMTICAIVASVAVVLIWTLAPWLAETVFDKPGSKPFIYLVAVAIPFMVLTEIVGNITFCLGHVRYYIFARTLAPQLLFGTFIIGLWLAGADPRLIAPALALAYGLAFAFALFGLSRSGTKGLMRTRGIYPIRELLRYAFPILLVYAMWMVLSWADLLTLGVFRSVSEVGIYRACMQIIVAFDMVAVAINAASARAFAISTKNGDRRRLDESYAISTRWLSVVAVPALVLVLTNSADLLGIMGQGFSSGWMALSILAIAASVHCYFGAAGYLLMISGKQAYETANAGIAALLSVLLNMVLVPPYGMIGAAYATGTALLVLNAMRIVQVRRIYGIRSIRAEILRAVAIGIVTGIIVYVAAELLGLHQGAGIGALLLRSLSVVGLFFLLYWRFGLLPDERWRLRAFLAARRR